MTEEQFVTYLVPAFIAFQSAFSGFFIRFGYALFQQWIRFRSRGVAVEATIVDKKTSQVESGGTTWFPVVLFTTDTGQVMRTQSADSTGLEPTVGDPFDILYLREDPQQITPKAKLFSWLGFGITAWIIPFFLFFSSSLASRQP